MDQSKWTLLSVLITRIISLYKKNQIEMKCFILIIWECWSILYSYRSIFFQKNKYRPLVSYEKQHITGFNNWMFPKIYRNLFCLNLWYELAMKFFSFIPRFIFRKVLEEQKDSAQKKEGRFWHHEDDSWMHKMNSVFVLVLL